MLGRYVAYHLFVLPHSHLSITFEMNVKHTCTTRSLVFPTQKQHMQHMKQSWEANEILQSRVYERQNIIRAAT